MLLLRFHCRTKYSVVFKPHKVDKVLVYAYTGLGNFIMYVPALRAMKKFIPQAKFTLLHENDTGCHEVVSGSNLFDKYIIVKINANWWIRFKWIYRIWKEKYNLIISEFHNVHLFIIILTVLSGAQYRLGHVSSPGWKNDWDFIYNIPVRMKNNQHEINRYIELVYALGVSKQTIDKRPFIQIDSYDINFAKKFISSHDVNSRDKIISIQLGTGPKARWKQWNLDKYRKLCDKLLDLPNIKVILLGSLNDVDMIESVSRRMKHNPILAAGKTTIKQAAAIIKESSLLISNDGGLMHVSVAVDTPVVAIFGPTDYSRTAPWGDKHTIIRKNLNCSPCLRIDGAEKVENCPHDYKCLNSITVDEVYEVVTKKLRSY